MTSPFSAAQWVWSVEQGDPRFVACRFRGRFDLAADTIVTCRVSADSRYVLFLDGKRIGHGPARSDIRHYVYETYEQPLNSGPHVFAALVLAYREDNAPVAEMHDRGAFLLEAQDSTGTAVCATGKIGDWVVQCDQAVRPRIERPTSAYYSIGAQEDVTGGLLPHGWEQPGFDASDWEPVKSLKTPLLREQPNDMADPHGRWRLIPRDIPLMRMERRTFDDPPPFPLTIALNTEQSFLFDPRVYVNAFPEITISGGTGSTVILTYAEALTRGSDKGIRDDREGTELNGFSDVYRPGGSRETYMPMHWRAFRFLKLTAITAGEPLTIDALDYLLTGYPWEYKAAFAVENGPVEIPKVLENDLRTIERCTDETFMDCPYYEQLQYVGDTRLQALFTYTATGDARLAARAVRLFDWSRLPEGLTQSRYPSAMEQVIPPFSLFWVMMIEDLLRYAPSERATVVAAIPGARGVLEWFARHLDPSSGVLGGPLPWWNFVDWPPEMPEGVPASAAQGLTSATITLQFLAGMQSYVRLSTELGDPDQAAVWLERAASLEESIRAAFWDGSRLREGPDDSFLFTQHAQAWAILTDVLSPEEQRRVAQLLHDDASLIPATLYHRFYVVEALAKVNRLEQLWTRWLTPWQDALKMHLTTWPEQPEPTRSDCHAWSSWPTYCFLTHVLGVKPGFGCVAVTPKYVDGWDRVSGTVVLPKSLLHIRIDWSRGDAPVIEQQEEAR